jgi:hypothetical protein
MTKHLMKKTYKYSIVEECKDGKSNKAILENIVPAYFVVQVSKYIQVLNVCNTCKQSN